MESGQIVEDGAPGALAEQAGSRYRQLLEAEQQVQRTLWQEATWRRWRVEQGQVRETNNAAEAR
jgi:hypothetical protein